VSLYETRREKTRDRNDEKTRKEEEQIRENKERKK
jgi:hypothetical protein